MQGISDVHLVKTAFGATNMCQHNIRMQESSTEEGNGALETQHLLALLLHLLTVGTHQG